MPNLQDRKATLQDSERKRKRCDQIADPSSQAIRHRPGARQPGRKKRDENPISLIKRSRQVRMRQADMIPEWFREKIKDMTYVINLVTQMVQNCVIAHVNHCHKIHLFGTFGCWIWKRRRGAANRGRGREDQVHEEPVAVQTADLLCLPWPYPGEKSSKMFSRRLSACGSS